MVPAPASSSFTASFAATSVRHARFGPRSPAVVRSHPTSVRTASTTSPSCARSCASPVRAAASPSSASRTAACCSSATAISPNSRCSASPAFSTRIACSRYIDIPWLDDGRSCCSHCLTWNAPEC